MLDKRVMSDLVRRHATRPVLPLEAGSLFDAVRDGFSFVAQRARHVRVHHDGLADYAASLPDTPLRHVFDMKHHYISNDAESLAAYVLILDAANFGSGYEPELRRDGWAMIDDSIYYTLSTRLKNFFTVHGSLTAQDMAVISPAQCAALFELPPGAVGREFSGLLAESLNELGQMIAHDYDGGFLAFVEAAQGSAETLAARLAQLPHFADARDYEGRRILFYKRAQIAAADLHLAFEHLGRTLFHDSSGLTMFPDNGVPHVLHVDGLLNYTNGLAGRIARGEEIRSGSAEEIEIRACAGFVVEKLAVLKGLCAMDIDHILWHRSVESPRYSKTSPHRTKTVFY